MREDGSLALPYSPSHSWGSQGQKPWQFIKLHAQSSGQEARGMSVTTPPLGTSVLDRNLHVPSEPLYSQAHAETKHFHPDHDSANHLTALSQVTCTQPDSVFDETPLQPEITLEQEGPCPVDHLMAHSCSPLPLPSLLGRPSKILTELIIVKLTADQAWKSGELSHQAFWGAWLALRPSGASFITRAHGTGKPLLSHSPGLLPSTPLPLGTQRCHPGYST